MGSPQKAPPQQEAQPPWLGPLCGHFNPPRPPRRGLHGRLRMPAVLGQEAPHPSAGFISLIISFNGLLQPSRTARSEMTFLGDVVKERDRKGRT